MTFDIKAARELADTVVDNDPLHEKRLAEQLKAACAELAKLQPQNEVLAQLAMEHHKVRDDLRTREIKAEQDRDAAIAEATELRRLLESEKAQVTGMGMRNREAMTILGGKYPDGVVERAKAVVDERDELHRQAKAVVDFVVDECDFRLVEFIGIDGPVRAVRKLKEQSDEFAHLIARQDRELQDTKATLETREAELAETHNELMRCQDNRTHIIKINERERAEMRNELEFMRGMTVEHTRIRTEIQRDAQRVHEQRNEAFAKLAEARRRPPMACTTCEHHNEQLVEIIQMLEPLVDVVDDEFMRVVAGYPWNTGRIHKAMLAARKRLEHASKHQPELMEMYGRILKHNPWGEGVEMICGACDPDELHEKLARPTIGLDPGTKDEGKVVTYRVDETGKPQVLDVRSAEPGEHCGGASCSVDAGGGCICPCATCVRKDVELALKTDLAIGPRGELIVTDTVNIPGVGEVTATTVGDTPERGVNVDCENCGARAGSTLDNRGFYRCHNCGYPGQ